jgi:hypothetical protein
LISKLAFTLKNPNVRKVLEKPGTREEILKELEKAEITAGFTRKERIQESEVPPSSRNSETSDAARRSQNK